MDIPGLDSSRRSTSLAATYVLQSHAPSPDGSQRRHCWLRPSIHSIERHLLETYLPAGLLRILPSEHPPPLMASGR